MPPNQSLAHIAPIATKPQNTHTNWDQKQSSDISRPPYRHRVKVITKRVCRAPPNHSLCHRQLGRQMVNVEPRAIAAPVHRRMCHPRQVVAHRSSRSHTAGRPNRQPVNLKRVALAPHCRQLLKGKGPRVTWQNTCDHPLRLSQLARHRHLDLGSRRLCPLLASRCRPLRSQRRHEQQQEQGPAHFL
jgi:hypothetical protein